MDAITCALNFIERAVVAARRERWAGFAAKQATHAKFLDGLDHALANVIDKSLAVANLTSADWAEPGWRYTSDGNFGGEVQTLREGYDTASPYGGWLLLSASGRLAILRPEGRQDDEVFLRF
jgi:hypothetical protein